MTLAAAHEFFKKEVIEEIQLYGDLHRFLPVMAHRHGFRVTEIEIIQSTKDTHSRVYSPGIYVRRMLDLLTIFPGKIHQKTTTFFWPCRHNIIRPGNH